MSLHYILDGCNIIHQIPTLIPPGSGDQRVDLARLVDRRKPQGSLRNKVTIVFDGQPSSQSELMVTSLQVIFSCHESADDRIRRIVDEAPNKKNFIVVTNDRAIQYAVRAMGAKVLSVQEFLEKLAGPSTKISPFDSTQNSAKNISKSLESEINEELKKIWLKKK